MCKSTNGFILSDVMRDFKKYTSKKIIQTIMEEPESRREWLLAYFEKACAHLKRDQSYKVWQDGYHPRSAKSPDFVLFLNVLVKCKSNKSLPTFSVNIL
jgi:hypothetical protein